jgi:hypothetical protein
MTLVARILRDCRVGLTDWHFIQAFGLKLRFSSGMPGLRNPTETVGVMNGGRLINDRVSSEASN